MGGYMSHFYIYNRRYIKIFHYNKGKLGEFMGLIDTYLCWTENRETVASSGEQVFI